MSERRLFLGQSGWIRFAVALCVGVIPCLAEEAGGNHLKIGIYDSNDKNLLSPTLPFLNAIADSSGIPNLHIEQVFMPMKRLLQEAADGHLDGLGYRVAETNQMPGLKGLIRVPTHLTSIRVGVFSMDSSLPCFTSWEDIKQSKDKFAIGRGLVWLQRWVDSLQLGSRCVLYDSIPMAADMLKHQRVRYVLHTYEIMEEFLRTKPNAPKIMYLGEIGSLELFLFLAPKHEKWVSAIDKGIAKVTNSTHAYFDVFSQKPKHNPKNCGVALW